MPETQKYYNIKQIKRSEKAQVWSQLTTSGLEMERVYSRRKR